MTAQTSPRPRICLSLTLPRCPAFACFCRQIWQHIAFLLLPVLQGTIQYFFCGIQGHQQGDSALCVEHFEFSEA